MKLFYVALFSLSMVVKLNAVDAIIGTTTVSANTGIYFISSTINMPDMTAGTTPLDYNIDLYSYTSKNKKLELLLQTTPALSDGQGHSIPLNYTFTPIGGTATALLSNVFSQILSNGSPSYRDGVTTPGFLGISTAALPTNQVSGFYTTGAIPVDIRMDGTTSTALGYLTLNVSVVEFIVIGFADTSADSSGVKFIGENIDFGSLVLDTPVTPISKDVFVHTNRDAAIQITFATTPPLLSTVDGVSTLPVTYSYSLNAVTDVITAGVPFVAFNGANSGTTSVGTITFAPDTPTTAQIAGTYAATINVVVSAM